MYKTVKAIKFEHGMKKKLRDYLPIMQLCHLKVSSQQILAIILKSKDV